MGHENRGRLTVEKDGEWGLYTQAVPEHARIIGVVTQGCGDKGALIRLNGRYYQANAGVFRALDGRKVAAALGEAGRPRSMDGGRSVRVYLDDETICRAKEMAGGNLSEGLRCAVWLATP